MKNSHKDAASFDNSKTAHLDDMLAEGIAKDLRQKKHFLLLKPATDHLHRYVSAIIQFRIIYSSSAWCKNAWHRKLTAQIALLVLEIQRLVAFIHDIDALIRQRNRQYSGRVIQQVHKCRVSW